VSAETERFARAVLSRAKRKLELRKGRNTEVVLGFGMFGVIGWSVAVPTVLGAFLGEWLDKYHAGPHSWTLALLVAGLFIGCASAAYWVASQTAANGHD